MHHRRFHRRRPPLGSRFYASENVLERLDEYQRDLEQELADVVELIKRLRAEEAPRSRRPSRCLIGNARASGGVPDQAGGRTRPQSRLVALTRAKVVPGAVSGTSSGSAGIADQTSSSLPRRLGAQCAEPAASRSAFVSSITFWATWAGTSS